MAEEKGFTAGFIIHFDDLETYRKFLIMANHFFGTKPIVSRIYLGKLYLTRKKPPDLKEGIDTDNSGNLDEYYGSEEEGDGEEW
jgi:hypothetical protein